MNNQINEQYINDLINQKLSTLQFINSNQTPFHIHNGADGTPMLDPINFLPFTIYSTIPTDSAPNGTMKLVYDGTNYRLYFRVNNLWKYASLT